MARIANGILGGFSGKVGTVVGSSWNSINYMRSLAASYRDAKSETQVCQRGKFTQAVRFLKAMPKFIRVGFGNHARGSRRTARQCLTCCAMRPKVAARMRR